VCKETCEYFFKFYPEPTAPTCALVRPEFEEECQLRVKLILHLKNNETKKAKKVRNILDGIVEPVPEEPVIKPEKPVIKPVISKPVGKRRTVIDIEPYCKKQGTYELTDDEVREIRDQLRLISS
jgi:hypothetical protein